MHRRNGPEAQRFAERRRREDESPRLNAQVPDLLSLRLDIEDRTDVGGSVHTRRVVVDRAPALFLVPCGDPRCLGEEHDITATIMRALHMHQASFHGTDECRGSVGTSVCSRVLRFDGSAEYRPIDERASAAAR